MNKKFWAETFLVILIATLLLTSRPAEATEVPWHRDPASMWRQDVLENPLGKQTNETLGVTDVNLSEWVGNASQFMIINAFTLVAGKEALVGGRAGGVLGTTAAMADGVLQNPPNLKTMAYVKRTLANNIFSPRPAYAATGFDYLDTIREIWSAMRNVSYAFMAVIIVVMGFMVMFRYHIDPRTVMTFTAALPRIVISLVLVTFSYPLAGFLIDITRVFKALIDATFRGAPFARMISIEPFQIIGAFLDNFIPISVITPLSFFLKGNIYLGGTGISATFIALVISVIALVVAFMLFFTLVFRYAGIFVQVIFAPLAFLWGALPGQEDTITNWFKSFAVNVLSFPVIYFMVNLANYIGNESLGRPMPMPGDIGWSSWPGIVETNVGGLVSFGILVAATKVPAALEDIFAVTPSPGVARAGVEPTKIAAKIPIIGSLLK